MTETEREIAAALSAARAEGERAGLERAAQRIEKIHRMIFGNDTLMQQVVRDIRALLPPAAPETKP